MGEEWEGDMIRNGNNVKNGRDLGSQTEERLDEKWKKGGMRKVREIG